MQMKKATNETTKNDSFIRVLELWMFFSVIYKVLNTIISQKITSEDYVYAFIDSLRNY